MTILSIAFKDLKQYARNVPALLISLAGPLVLTAIMGFAFSGITGSGTPELQRIQLQVANLDAGQPGLATSLGQEIVQILQGSEFEKLVKVSLAGSEGDVRSAVDRREADMALIIPAGFSAAVMSPDSEPAEVVLYYDPAASTRASIAGSIVGGLLDEFSGAHVAAQVTAEQLAHRGAPTKVVAEAAARAAERYTQDVHSAPLVAIESSAVTRESREGVGSITAKVYAGMLVFFVFFAGATAAEGILREDEERTLRRLFTTPLPRTMILAGKTVSVLVQMLVQTIILLLAAMLLFGIRWGQPAGVAVQVLATAIASGGFGLLLMSFVRDTKQAGFVMGGVMSITGMVGGTFTVAIPGLPRVLDTIALCTPHGWAMRGWGILLRGGGIGELLLPAGVLVAIGAILFIVGTLRFQQRFA